MTVTIDQITHIVEQIIKMRQNSWINYFRHSNGHQLQEQQQKEILAAMHK